MNYMLQALSPINSQVISLFDTVEDNYHHVSMENLYNLTTFYKSDMHHPKKMLCHGVEMKDMRTIPLSVVHKEVKNRQIHLTVRCTIKTARL